MVASKQIRRSALLALIAAGCVAGPTWGQDDCCPPESAGQTPMSWYYDESPCPPGQAMPLGTPAGPMAPSQQMAPAPQMAPGSVMPGQPAPAPSFAPPSASAPPAPTTTAPTPSAQQFDTSNADFDAFASATEASQASTSSPTFTAFSDTPGMIGDFFGSGNVLIQVPSIFQYNGVNGSDLGGGVFGFDVNGNVTDDLFTVGAGQIVGTQEQFLLSEPVNPTDADIPINAGQTNTQYVGGLATTVNAGPAVDGDPFNVSYLYETELVIPASPSQRIGRMKLAENVSPIPRDRVYLNYSHFDNVPIASGISVDRFTPGLELKVCSDMTSFEIRTPFAATINSTIFDNAVDTSNLEFGDVFLSLKTVLYQCDQFILSTGLSTALPTADDLRVRTATQNGEIVDAIRVENESIHLLPFLGWLFQGDKGFFQGFIQVDVDVTGDPVFFQDSLNGVPTLTYQDDIFETSLLYVDFQYGRWLYKNRGRGRQSKRNITAVALLTELHINQTLESSDSVSRLFTTGIGNTTSALTVGRDIGNSSVTNALAGLMFEYKQDTTVTVAYGAPIGNSADQQFDGELRVLLNRAL